jgi:TolB-like protein/predicted Ser/Thr protein kinase
MLTGRMLGAYRVLEKLGEGGMGEVYKAHDPRLNRTVAIKILSPAVATPDRLDRFEQEARSASALNHPNILTIHDVGRDGDTAYFAMELVEGQTLREVMAAGRVPLRRILQLAHQIADGLAKAHAAGIVHRDLKPENVMVTADGLVKIVDFGLAKLAERPGADVAEAMTRTAGTTPGLVMGTIGYMSPEQASGRPVDYRSDQFALGLLLYELATRTRPFERPTTAQWLAATIEAEPTPVAALNPEIPPHLATVVARCLAKDPADRYESTRDLARDLKAMLDTPSQGSAAVAPTARRVPALYLALGAVAIVAAAAGVAWFRRPVPAPPAAPARPLLAVRAFRSLSPDPAQGYFAAGMTEEIRGQLSQVASLRLLSRNALDVAEGADASRVIRDLGVTQLVDGSVRVDGSRVRISAELIDAASQQTLWSQQYDRDLADMLAVQSDVAMQIAHALRASLSPDEKRRLEQRPTENAAAYAMYLQAQPMPSFDRAKNLAAIDMLRKAIAMDPRFAAAQARVAFRLVTMGYYDDPSYIDNGIADAQAALRVNPSLPFAYFALATGYSMKGMDAEARVSFLKALELDPNNAGAMLNLSVMEANFGNLDQSLAWARRGFGLSGKKGNDFYHMALPLVTMRADEESRTWLAEAERRFPGFPRTQIMQALLDVYSNRAEQAWRRMSALATRLPEDEEVKFMRADLAFLTGSPDIGPAHDALAQSSASNTILVAETVGLRRAYLAGLRGDKGAAALVIEAARAAQGKIQRGDRTPALRVELAAAAVLRRDQAGAIEWLGHAYNGGYRDYSLLERDPILVKLDPDPRFRDIVDRMRKDVEAQRSRARQGGLLDIDALLASADPKKE